MRAVLEVSALAGDLRWCVAVVYAIVLHGWSLIYACYQAAFVSVCPKPDIVLNIS